MESGAAKWDLANSIHTDDIQVLVNAQITRYQQHGSTGTPFKDYMNAVNKVNEAVENVTFNDELGNAVVDRSSSRTVAMAVAKDMMANNPEILKSVDAQLTANESKRNVGQVSAADATKAAAAEVGRGLTGLGATHQGAAERAAIPTDRGNPVKAERNPFEGQL